MRWSIAIHGGAGVMDASNTAALDAAGAELKLALEAGMRVLAAGGSAMDAVLAAVTEMEDCPLFNAGKGAVYTRSGKHELEASIMTSNLRCGAAALLTRVKNPIALAMRVMQHSPHVFLSGPVAEQFAENQGLELVDNTYFSTASRHRQWEECAPLTNVSRQDTLVQALHQQAQQAANNNGQASGVSQAGQTAVACAAEGSNAPSKDSSATDSDEEHQVVATSITHVTGGPPAALDADLVYFVPGHHHRRQNEDFPSGSSKVDVSPAGAERSSGMPAVPDSAADFTTAVQVVDPASAHAITGSASGQPPAQAAAGEGELMQTVGAVAIDCHGNLAAATSTGGRTNKWDGRIGDTPVQGAGNYANSRVACSGTGLGEEFIRHCSCHDVAARLQYKQISLKQAVHEVMRESMSPGDGGIIAVDSSYNIVMDFTSPGMYRAAANHHGYFEVGIL